MKVINQLINVLVVFLISIPLVYAAVLTQGVREPYRPLIQRQGSEPPLNMIVLGRDHRLWYEAYNDASDLDGDDILDVGYKGYLLKAGESTAAKGNFKIDYYGYFDSYKCYRYNTNNGRFVPVEVTANKKCANDTTAPWSGDYLNYLTTSRMDAIRKVLYGGYRQVDTATETVLRRAWVPQDAHAFGKEYTSTAYDGYAVEDYTPFSQPDSGRRHIFANTTLCNGSCSTAYNEPPKLRYVLSADFRVWEWLSIERPVADSQYATGNNNRVTIKGTHGTIVDLTVDVQVCVSDKLEDNCKQYGTTYKPIGLIQQYGDNDAMRFGLLTGSYKQNTQGGVLRKNISTVSDEINLANGTFNASADGIISTLNKLRIQGITNSREYFNLGDGDDKCSYAQAFSRTLPDGSCSAWGNPVGEMLYEAVNYFSGGTKTSGYNNDTKGASLGLPEPAWTDPYGISSGTVRRNSICAKPYVTLMSDISPNFDAGINSATFNGKSYNRDALLDNIWAQEFGAGTVKSILIGSNGTDNNLAPTAKNASTFKNLSGLPDEAGKEGTYSTAAIAYFARTNDINAAPDTQNVTTFSVALASPLPKIRIPIGSKFITFIPYAKSPSNGGGTVGGTTDYRPTNQIVDYYIESIYNVTGYAADSSVNGGRPQYKILVNFEDVEYGGDHDMDAIAKYTINVNANNTVTITTDSNYAGGGIDQHMGYIIDGSNNDGIYLVVKDQGGADSKYWMDAKPATDPYADSGKPIDPQGKLTALTDTRTFNPSTAGSTVTELKSPLWFAAKYGGFIDADIAGTDGYNKPDKAGEWEDSENPGTPANFYLVTNPLTLSEQLGKAFARIDSTARSTSPIGSGSNSSATSLRIYRGYFQMDQWSGGVAAITLSDTSDTTSEIWNTKNYLVQHGRRNIFTHNGANPLVLNNTILNASNATADKLNTLQLTEMSRGLTSPNTAADRLQFLRGDNSKEGSVFRVRNSTSGLTNYYGDVLDAQPYAAGAPTRGNNSDAKGYEAYRTEEDDSDINYYGFAVSDTASNRRSKVFTGANDGMLHIVDDSQLRDKNNQDTGVAKTGTETILNPKSAVSRPGKELMAYMPSFVYTRSDGSAKISEYSNLTGYNHEFFVNGQVSMADMIHAGAWKTVLTGTVGFGGKGIYALDVTKDVFDGTPSEHVLFEYSADNDRPNGLVDPTDSTKKLSDMGYILGRTIMGKTNDGKWRVIVGNGYNSESGEAVLKLININDLEDVISLRTGAGASKTSDGALTPSNVNGLSAPVMVDGVINSDGTLDTPNGTIDVVYAGDLQGNLWRFDLTSASTGDWSVSNLFRTSGKCGSGDATEDCTQAITVRPAVTTFLENGKNIKLVMFGTGKVIEDCDKTAVGCLGEAYVNSFYAVRDYDNVATNNSISLANKKSKLQQQVIKTYNKGTKSQEIFRYIEGDTSSADCVKVYDEVSKILVGTQCPSHTVDYADSPIATGTELGWYHDLPEVENIASDAISAKVVGDIQTAGTGRTAIVKYSTFAPVNLQDECDLKGISAVMAPNIFNGGQTLARLTTSGIDKIINVGVVFDKAYPSGSTIVNNANSAGLGDVKGGGDCYNCDGKKSSGKTILVTPDIGQAPGTNPENKKWDISLRKGVVVPVSWREILESDVK